MEKTTFSLNFHKFAFNQRWSKWAGHVATLQVVELDDPTLLSIGKCLRESNNLFVMVVFFSF